MESTTRTTTSTYTPNADILEFVESDYISLEDNTSKKFEFLPGRERVVSKTYEGNPITKVQFLVIDLERKDLQRGEKKLSFYSVSSVFVC